MDQSLHIHCYSIWAETNLHHLISINEASRYTHTHKLITYDNQEHCVLHCILQCLWWWMQVFPFALYRSSHPAESFRPWEGPHLWRRHPDGCLQQWRPFLQLTLLYRGPKCRYIYIYRVSCDGNLVGKIRKMIIHMGGYGVLLIGSVRVWLPECGWENGKNWWCGDMIGHLWATIFHSPLPSMYGIYRYI